MSLLLTLRKDRPELWFSHVHIWEILQDYPGVERDVCLEKRKQKDFKYICTIFPEIRKKELWALGTAVSSN